MRLNLNDEIKVKLTEHGKDIYYHQYDRLNTAFGREVCKPKYPKVDENGYTTFQLWCFIELYGVHMGMTLPNVIEPLDIVFDAPTIEPERKKGKWIKHERGYWTFVNKDGERDGWIPDYECSECGSRGWKYADNTMNFCPNCGSDMREDQDESKAETNGCIPGDCGESS